MAESRRPAGSGRIGRHTGSVGLAVAMAMVNVLGYGSVLLVSGTLGPADFGAVAALTGLGVVCVIPGGTLQVLVAARRSHGHSLHGVTGVGLLVGVVVAVLLAALSPVVEQSFSLSSVWPALWLAAAVVPTTIGSVQQGALLGERRLAALTAVALVSGLSRLTASALLALGDADVATVMAGWAASGVVPVLLGMVLVARDAPSGDAWHWLPALLRSSIAFGALIAMTNVDVVLARHYLSAHDSGLYGVASMFARVVFWATQFIAMLVVPRLAATPGRRIVVRAYVAVLVVASPALAVLALDAELTLRLLGLGAYREAADDLVLFGLLGVLWACIQVSTFVGIARARGTITIALWCGVAVQVLTTVVTWHDSIGEVLAASMAGAAVTIVVVWLPRRLPWQARRVSRPSGTASGRAA
jgi:O-antigen/teichoic acid export membrane protein